MVERPANLKSSERLNHSGELVAIYGPMFSGKTGELIDYIDAESYADKIAVIIKPSNDTRYHATKVITHSKKEIDAFPVDRDNPRAIFKLVRKLESKGDLHIVAIDEAQFFHEDIVSVVEKLVEDGKDVVTAGLASDFRNEPFGAMPALIARADRTFHEHATCTHRSDGGKVCGNKFASKTQRIIEGKPANYDDDIVVVGGEELYEARCRQHHEVPGKPGRN